jgi:hypothetical protein
MCGGLIMLTFKLKGGDNLLIKSKYEEGKHEGFMVAIDTGDFDCKSLDKVLSKKQIKSIEALLAVTISKYYLEGINP